MRIAIISDTHLGYQRFEKDAFNQAEQALLQASEKADMMLFAGDVFDIKIPKLETLDSAISLFKKVRIPVFAIHGNHERRAREMINPAKILHTSGAINYLHAQSAIFEKNGKKVQVFGIGNVPDEYADAAVKKSMERYIPDEGAFKVLIIHQSIKELVPHGKNELSLEYLETLPFDLIVNGHLHGSDVLLNGKFLMPGSTVITQLRKEETSPKGFFLFDVSTRHADFIQINSRPFFYEELIFQDADEAEIREKVSKKIEEIKSKSMNALIAIKIHGSLKDGAKPADLKFPESDNVFIDNRLESKNLSETLSRIRDLRNDKLSVRDLALKELSEKTKDRLTSFDPIELFDKLVSGTDETMEYIQKADGNGKNTARS